MASPCRCVNLDWLEVHCLEPIEQPHDPDYFRSCGFIVEEREYGTRIYNQMFTICTYADEPLLEVRRDPKSAGAIGIHEINECHLRLVNRSCYRDDAATFMANFIAQHNYTFRRISRVDICLDFEKFDKGDDPQAFLRRYLRRKYSKINQANIHAHGADTWSGQEWNSISWGSPASDIGTKFYNKTMELYDPIKKTYKKPYIRQAWAMAGLIDDWHKVTKKREDGTEYTPQIWRVEFSIRSSVRKWFKIELNGKTKNYQSIHNTLEMYDSKAKLLTLFASLAQHYFHFKHFEENQRKDRCEDKVLFDFSGEQTTYKLAREPLLADKPRQNPFLSLAVKLAEYRTSRTEDDIRKACNIILKALEDEALQYDLQNPFSKSELYALRVAMSLRCSGVQTDAGILMREVKQLLQINDNTLPF